MNYIGSKYKLLSFLREGITNVVGSNLSEKVFCDIFAGTGAVGRHFKKEVKQIISNDIEYYSYILNENYIGNNKEINRKEELILELNQMPLIENGLIYNNYCMGSGSGRQYFSDNNGKIIDTIRNAINLWKDHNIITDRTYYFLLASLLESSDKVANTASVYGAFLKHIKRSASKNLILEPADFDLSDNDHKVYNKDSNEFINDIQGDILYLDPPYNHRQYGANYHILNTIAKYDDFEPKGKTGMRSYIKSDYCRKNEVLKSFDHLIKNADFKYIFLSYNNEGLMSEEQVRNIMSKYGKYDLIAKEHQRFKADKTENRNHKADKTFEYLHILEKN